MEKPHVKRAATDAAKLPAKARGVDQKIQYMDRVQVDGQLTAQGKSPRSALRFVDHASGANTGPAGTGAEGFRTVRFMRGIAIIQHEASVQLVI